MERDNMKKISIVIIFLLAMILRYDISIAEDDIYDTKYNKKGFIKEGVIYNNRYERVGKIEKWSDGDYRILDNQFRVKGRIEPKCKGEKKHDNN